MESDKKADPWMTAQEAADYVGLALGTVWNKARAGEMPSYRVGKRSYRFRRSELDAWIESGATKPAA